MAKNYDSITGRWRNRTFPRVRWHLKNSGSSGGNPALQLSEPSCLNVKRNCAGRNRKILNVVARSSSGKTDNAVMDSGVLRAVVTGYGEAPMPGNGANDLLPSASQPERRIYALGATSWRNYRTRIFESVDLNA